MCVCEKRIERCNHSTLSLSLSVDGANVCQLWEDRKVVKEEELETSEDEETCRKQRKEFVSHTCSHLLSRHLLVKQGEKTLSISGRSHMFHLVIVTGDDFAREQKSMHKNL